MQLNVSNTLMQFSLKIVLLHALEAQVQILDKILVVVGEMLPQVNKQVIECV